jgi:hypothetical protein
MKNVIWFAVFLLGTAVVVGSPLLLTRLTLPPRVPSEVFHELATTQGVEIRTKRSHSAPTPLKGYQHNDIIVAKPFNREEIIARN